MSKSITVEQVEEFYDCLMGEELYVEIEKKGEFYPLFLEMDLGLSPDQAFHVIWILQEVFNVVSSDYEKCAICHRIYDCNYDGHYVDSGNDSDDEWYREENITPEMVASLKYGWNFCDEGCELKFWDSDRDPGLKEYMAKRKDNE